MGTFATSAVVGFACSTAVSQGTGVTGPTTAAAAGFPVAKGATTARRLEPCVLSSLLLQGSLGLQAQPLWPEAKTADILPLFPQFYLLYVFQSTHLQKQTGGSLQHPSVLGRGTFVEFWMFYQLQNEGERQRRCLTPHDADITPNLILKVIKLKPSFTG